MDKENIFDVMEAYMKEILIQEFKDRANIIELMENHMKVIEWIVKWRVME